MPLPGLLLVRWAQWRGAGIYICWVCFYQASGPVPEYTKKKKKKVPLRTKMNTETGVRIKQTKDGVQVFLDLAGYPFFTPDMDPGSPWKGF